MVSVTPRPLYSWKRYVTNCVEGWLGPRTGLAGCGKSHPHRDPLPGPCSEQRKRLCWCLVCRRVPVERRQYDRNKLSAWPKRRRKTGLLLSCMSLFSSFYGAMTGCSSILLSLSSMKLRQITQEISLSMET